MQLRACHDADADAAATRRGFERAVRVTAARDDTPEQIVWTPSSASPRPLLQHHGFMITERRTPVLGGVAMTNSAMRRAPGDAATER